MTETLRNLAVELPLVGLIAIILLSVFVLSKGADILVTHAVAVSRRFNVSPVIIGATVVSLGTTSPETAVSVLSAVQGDPGLALGNAVGSVICNTGLIVGIAALIRPIRVDRALLVRQGLVQYGSAVLLVAASLPVAWQTWRDLFSDGGTVPRLAGLGFLLLLGGYLTLSVRWSRADERVPGAEDLDPEAREGTTMTPSSGLIATIAKLVAGLGLVVAASQVLIPAVEATALRLGVPRAVVAASLVALGTSLPELVTAIAASRRGHSDLALGNVIGANVLNVLFVVGLSAAVTPSGLAVSSDFYRMFYPSMLIAGLVLYGGAVLGRMRIGRVAGAVLLLGYLGFVVLGYSA